MPRFALWIAAICLTICTGCKSVDTPPSPTPGGTVRSGQISLSPADAEAIGNKIWKNESNRSIDGLTAWNAGEDFPSLGIGHFIWYVDGREGPFQESFPPLIEFMKRNAVSVPQWVADAKGSPWKSRDEFLSQKNSPQMKELRQFLAGTVPTQTRFIVLRLEQALPKMRAVTPSEADRRRLEDNFFKVASTRTGVYSLIDYVNFKGEGVKAEEKYKGQGWGLRDVLLEMKSVSKGPGATAEFSEAAKRVLKRRIENSPAERGESRWHNGWMNRCDTYKQGF